MNRTLLHVARLWMASVILLGLVTSAQADVTVQLNGASTPLPSPTGKSATWVGAWGKLSHFNDGDDRVFVQIANYSTADLNYAYFGSQQTDATKLVASGATGSSTPSGYPCTVDSDCKRSYEICGGPVSGCTDISQWQTSPFSCSVDGDCPSNFVCQSGTLSSGSSTMACMCNTNAACGPDRVCIAGSCLGTPILWSPPYEQCPANGCPTGTTCWYSYCLGPACSTDSDCSKWSVYPSCNTTAYPPGGICTCTQDTDCAGMGFNTPKCQPISYNPNISQCVEGGTSPTVPLYSPWGNQNWGTSLLATKPNTPPTAMSAIFSFDHTSYGGPSIHIGFIPIFHNDGSTSTAATTTTGKPLELQIWVQGAPSSITNDIKMAWDILKLTVDAIVAPEMDIEEGLKFIKDSLEDAKKVVDLADTLSINTGEDVNQFNAGIVAPGSGLDTTSAFPSYAQKTSGATNRIDVVVYHPDYPFPGTGSLQHALYIQIYTVMDDCDQKENGLIPDDTGYCSGKILNCDNAAHIYGYNLTYNSSNCSAAFFDETNGGIPIANKVVMNVHSYAQVAAYVGAN